MPFYEMGNVDNYNTSKLRDELATIPEFETMVVEPELINDSVVMVLRVQLSAISGAITSAIDTIVNEHDNSLTDRQLTEQAQATIQAQLDRSKRCLHLILPVYQRRAIDLNLPYGTLDAITAYNNVRAVVIATWNEATDLGAFLMNYLRNICMQEQNIDFDNPPVDMTVNYATRFNEAVYKVIDSISQQYKF